MLAYRPEIDGLRAIAIAAVVLFHSGGSLFAGGYVGVDIFFVISGFLISSIIIKAESEGGFSYLDFYARRARRILPAALFMIVIVTLLSLAILLPVDLVEYGKILIYTLLFGANFTLTGAPPYFDARSQDNPLLHMWSLAVEEQFYLLWPTLLVAILALFARKRFGIAVVLLALCSLLASEILVRSLPKSAFYHLPSRSWELLAGAMLAMGFVPTIRSRALAEALSFGGIALIIAPVFLYDKETAFPGFTAIPPVLGCALVMHAGSAVKTSVAAMLGLRPIVFIGLISYSLYLWHWPVFALSSYVLMRETTMAETLTLVAVAIVFATFSWLFVEKPFRIRHAPVPTAGPRLWLSIPLRREAYAAIALTACLAALGSYFQESKGAGWRLSAEVRSLVRAAVEVPGPACAHRTLCEIGEPNIRTDIVLWGDSHALHYYPLISAAYPHNITYLHFGCIPLPGAQLTFKGSNYVPQWCVEAKYSALQRILKAKPKLVILAARWTCCEPLSDDRVPLGMPYFVRRADEPPTLDHSRQIFAEELKRTAAQLTQAGIDVLLMAQVPEMQAPVSRCLAISRHLHLDERLCLSIDRAKEEKRQAEVNRILGSIEANNSHVKVFWPFPLMCDSELCYAARDGYVFYRDDHHLTPKGALSMVDAFKSFLSDALFRDHNDRELPISTRASADVRGD